MLPLPAVSLPRGVLAPDLYQPGGVMLGQPEFREQEVPLIVCDFQPIQMAVRAQAGVLTWRDGHRGRPSIIEVNTVYSGLS